MVSVLDRHIQASPDLFESGVVHSEAKYLHQPVLSQETVAYLAVKSGGVYVDATVGEGGHAQAVLQAATPGGRLLGIDLDPQVVGRARQRLLHLPRFQRTDTRQLHPDGRVGRFPGFLST